MDSSPHNNNPTYLTWTLTMERVDGDIDIKNMNFSSYVALPNPITVMPNEQTDCIYEFSTKDENKYDDRENSNFIWEISSPENTDNTNIVNASFILDLSSEQNNHDDITTSFTSKISTSIDNDKDIFFECVDEPSTPINTSSPNIDGMNCMAVPEQETEHKVSVLILREQEMNEEFSIRMLFDSKIKFTFTIDKELRKDHSHRTIIYRVDLDVKRNESGELMVFYEKKWKQVHTYQLYISRPGYLRTTHYNDNQTRTLHDPLNTTLNFILDVNFSGSHFSSAGGKAFKRLQDTVQSLLRNFAGSNVPWWNRLCLFTYYLVRSHDYASMKALIDQFTCLHQSDTRQLTREEFNGFFQECSACFTSLLKDFTDKSELLKHLVCIIGLLPTGGNWNYDHILNFITTILQNVLNYLDSVLESATLAEWTLFIQGFTTLLCIHFLAEKFVANRLNKQNTGAFALLCRIPVKDQYRTLADAVLARFKTFQQTLSSSNWTELMVRVNPDQFIFNILEKTKSIEAYFNCITKTLEMCGQVNDLRDKLQVDFDERVRNDFEINLESIRFLLEFLQRSTQQNTEGISNHQRTMCWIIESNAALRKKISTYFSNLKIDLNNVKTIRDIFRFPHSTAICNVNLQDFLSKSLKNKGWILPFDFYHQWFLCFLVPDQQLNSAIYNNSPHDYEKLLKDWAIPVTQSSAMFLQLLKNIDQLITAFTPINNDRYRSCFIDHIIDLCFQQKSMTSVLNDGLITTQEELFLKPFKTKFAAVYFNDMKNTKNPLYGLINHDKQQQGKNRLVRDLIHMASDSIEISAEEILQDTFSRPNQSSFTYQVLFEDCFQTSKVRQKIVTQLLIQLNIWEEQGLRANEIHQWNNYTNDQREVARRIWNCICTIGNKQSEINTLVLRQEAEMNNKLEFVDNVVSCLDAYCQDACDKTTYDNHLQIVQKQLREKVLRLVQIPAELNLLLPFAKLLNPLIGAHAWRTFLEQHNKALEFELPQADVVDSDLWILGGDRSSQKMTSEPMETDSDNITSKIIEKTCLSILEKAIEIRTLFKTELGQLCLRWKELPISHLIRLFPNMQFADQDLRTLAPLLDPAVVPDLEKLIGYWKIHERIAHIHQGSINILKHLQGQSSSSTATLVITEEALGATCHEAYENYCVNYSQCYSDQALRLIAQYSSSAELLTFLHSLKDNEGDSLLEAVNDFDETLTDTKTMVDFATLKTFIDRAYANIKETRKQKTATPLTLNDVAMAFQNLMNEPEFKNILDCFEPCSKSLGSIKRIHEDSTNKGQSKRRRIFDITAKSSFKFVHESFNISGYVDDRFDIQNQEHSLRYDDLSELRDRARLIEYSNNKIKNETDQEIEELHLFVSLVDVIETILNNLALLYMAGHPSVPEYLAPHKEFICNKVDYYDLVEFSSMLDDMLKRWESHLCTMYRKYINLTHFSRQQIWTVENFLYNETVESTTHAGYHLLKFIDIEPQSIRTQCLVERSKDPLARLEYLGRILTTPYLISEGTVPSDSSDPFIKPVYLIETSDEGILRAILSLFQFSGESPRMSHLFYCTDKTSWFEIRAFIYRCFYSRTLQQLIRPELLSPLIQDRFIGLLNELLVSEPKAKFRMVIISTSDTGHWQLLNGLRTLQIVHSVHDQEMLEKEELERTIQGLLGKDDTCVTSKISGLGKSTYVLDEIRRMNKHYIKFPIGGEISADTLAERLRSQGTQLVSSTAALHIDIGTIENVRQLNELLYCLLLFRSFRFGQEAIYVPSDIPIYVELDASLHTSSLQGKMVVLNYLKKKHLNSIDLNSLKVNDWPEIHGVIAYLQAIKKGEITKKNITKEQLENELIQKRFDMNTCLELLKEHFIQNQNVEFMTWTKLSIFIAIYYKLFLGFSRCGHFLVEFMDKKSQLRMNILQALLQSSDQFTSVSVETVRNSQRSVNESNLSLSEAVVRWDTTKPFTVVFTDTDDPLFVYRKVQDIPHSLVAEFEFYKRLTRSTDQQSPLPDYDALEHVQFFLKLVTLSKKYFSKSICKNCFNQYEHTVEQCTECKTSGTLLRPAKASTRDIETILEKMGRKLETSYVLTPDNYIKMLLIYLRVQSGVPVLIMGETGCGKTSLIQFLCQRILDDDMAIFRIHAGVTSEQIITTMRDYIKKALKYSTNGQNKRLWVFLDEFNTTPSIGLFKEIVCERTLLGEPLPTNMVFLGACNPQRRKNDQIAIDDNIGIKKERYEMQRVARDGNNALLLYSVVAIPETMLEYVWDYGFLDQTTETKYIRTMLKRCMKFETHDKWYSLMLSLISISQQYFREHEDVSSVSLRDVARFCNLYNWFYGSILIREGEQTFGEKHFGVLLRAGLMALLLCYYFRLRSPNQRRDYLNLIENALGVNSNKQSPIGKYLIDLLRREQLKLVDGMELPPGTAKNQALIDNIFVLLVCIVNRIPVILCGKPGCSKTSAIQIVISNLKGKRSEQPYCRTLPELIAVSYQGSQNCTSESIINVFQRAKKYLKAKSATELLPVVVFDEIGLAELSPHNPLKVLHSELEVDACQHAFVGLSNWRLDASKMNRALYVACADPDIGDLQNTATTIMSSMLDGKDQVVYLEGSILKGLATAYFDLYEQINIDQQYNNYFGLRDFYSLIKGIVRDLADTKEQDRYESIRRQLKINFDGIFDGAEYMWQRFCHHTTRQHLTTQYSSPTFKQLLDRSLTSRTGRYLMLIGENERAIDYVERYIIAKHQTSPVRTLIGSSLSGDLVFGTTYTEQYNYRLLMDIILHAETNVTLVMRQMGHLYESLYDLFNQSFAISARKKYCRIALGALYHPRCLVHDEFYCVVFVRQQDLAKCDPPFLNRFEKHLIDIDSLIHEHHAILTKKFLTWLAELLPSDGNKHFLLLQHLFVDYSSEYICNLVMDAFDYLNIPIDNNDDHTEAVISFCKDKLILTSSLDLLFVTSIQTTKDKIHPLIEQYYKVHNDLSFLSVVNQELAEAKISNRIVYTYTQLYHRIDCIKNDRRIDEVKLSDFKTVLELIKRIKKHYNSHDDTVRLLLIRVDYHREHHHILMLKHILLNERSMNTNRGIWLIFHLQRNMLNKTTNDVLFNGWSTVMIDNMNENKIIPQSILLNPSYYDLITQPQYLLSENMFDELFDWCLTKLRYTVARQDGNQIINTHRDLLIKFIVRSEIESNDSLRSIIQRHLKNLIQTSINHPDSSQFLDWRRDLLTNPVTLGSSRSCGDAVQMTVGFFYRTYLLLLLGHLEKYTFIESYSFLVAENTFNTSNPLHQLWHERLNTTLETIDFSLMNINVIQIPLVSDLRLPCAQYEYGIIRSIRQVLAQRVQTEEIDLDQLNHPAFEQLRHRSAYGKHIESILNNELLFNHYYHDQLALVRDETKIYQLSTAFIQSLLSTNSIRTVTQRLNHLFTDYEELIELLRLFEIGVQLIADENILKFNQQFIDLDKTQYAPQSDLYRLVLTNEQFYLIPPRTSISTDEVFTCDGDPWIETSLMNLIELLVSQSVIADVQSIEQLTSVYGQIAQGVLELSSYPVNNLEKLRSFTSLLRCIAALLPSDRALEAFKIACFYGKFDAAFTSCEEIHTFIDYLNKTIHRHDPKTSSTVIRQSLLKLEMEFLKNWLVDHSDQYDEVLKLIGQSEDMWQYSAKIFSYIERKLNLLTIVRDNHGRIPSIEDSAPLDRFLQETNNSTRKIERLFVNRLHMALVLGASEIETIEQVLKNDFEQFEENIRLVQTEPSHSNLSLICLISWLKYYAQLYAFALNHDSRNAIMLQLDRLFTSNESSFGSTLKLFVVKQLCQMSKVNLQGLREIFANRNLLWIRSFISRSSNQEGVQNNLILPTPLFECRTKFEQVHLILIDIGKIDQWRQLIVQSSTNQKIACSFLIWFIHQYSQFYTIETSPDRRVVQAIEHDLNRELNECFTPIGYQFLHSLCTNFKENSYFRLQPTMTNDAVHRRLIVLNIIALLISFKALGRNSYLGNLLFDRNQKMPENYTEHVQTTICLPAFLPNDPFITQMIDVRVQVQARLPTLSRLKRFIYQCSANCPWIFYFEDCGDPNDRRQCPMCHQDIGAIEDGVLIKRDPPQLKISIEDGFKLIAKYIEDYNRKISFGYHDRTSAEQSNTGEKPDHLQHSISYRFIHMFIHATLLFLDEQDYLSEFDRPKREHFREHFEKDLTLLAEQLNEGEECYLWLFKLFNHLLDEQFLQEGLLDHREKVVQLETSLEQKLIFTHMNSIPEEIRQYKLAYMDFLRECHEKFSLERYVDELQENEQQFPLLNYFNVTNIHTANPMNDFFSKLELLPYGKQAYPITAFLLRKMDSYANIRHLYPIVAFTSHLIQKFDYRIKRNDALSKTISEYVNQGSDCEITMDLYQKFVDAWYKITLTEVQYRCQTAKIEHNIPQEEFARRTAFATVLLNTSKDESGILLAACLTSIGQLQNEIVNFFHENIIGNAEKSRRQRTIPIQAIRAEHVLNLTSNDISVKLITDGFTINYEYGMGKEIIYDYEEIELTLSNIISRLPLINTDEMNYFNYQFELYGENSSLINDVRARVKQELLTEDERTKLRGYILDMSNEGILHYLGSLDYVFTYLSTTSEEFGPDPSSIQAFVQTYINTTANLNENVLRRQPFSTISLKYIINLYELLEEKAFDQVLRPYVKQELCEETFPANERRRLVDEFIDSTLNNNKTAVCLQNLNCWIAILKRIMVRVLSNTSVHLDVPLNLYLGRQDLWTGDVTITDIQSITVSDDILLRHTFVILKGLETRRDDLLSSTTQVGFDRQKSGANELQTSQGQIHQATTWHVTNSKSGNAPKVIGTGKGTGKKLR